MQSAPGHSAAPNPVGELLPAPLVSAQHVAQVTLPLPSQPVTQIAIANSVGAVGQSNLVVMPTGMSQVAPSAAIGVPVVQVPGGPPSLVWGAHKALGSRRVCHR